MKGRMDELMDTCGMTLRPVSVDPEFSLPTLSELGEIISVPPALLLDCKNTILNSIYIIVNAGVIKMCKSDN